MPTPPEQTLFTPINQPTPASARQTLAHAIETFRAALGSALGLGTLEKNERRQSLDVLDALEGFAQLLRTNEKKGG